MRLSAIVVLLSSVASIGCAKEKPLAPTEMTDLVRYMFDNFDDEEALEAAVTNLDPWLRENATSEEAQDGYRLDPLLKDDVDTVDRPPGTQLDELLGAAVGSESNYDLDSQAIHIVDKDQLWANSSYDRYNRAFIEGSPSSFKKGEGRLRTVNDVQTSKLGVTIPYTLYKDYHWIETEDGQRAIVARSWIEDKGCNDSGNSCLLQSYSIDHFHADGGKTLRLTATWSQISAVINIADDLQIKSLAEGIFETIEAADTYLDER